MIIDYGRSFVNCSDNANGYISNAGIIDEACENASCNILLNKYNVKCSLNEVGYIGVN